MKSNVSSVSSSKISPVIIHTRALGQGQNPLSLSFDATLLDYPEFSGTATVTGIITREGDRLSIRAEASVDGAFECTRCAEPFSEKITVPISLDFVPSRLHSNESDPNVHAYDPLSDSDLDLLEDVRDALVLAIPMRHLCKSDCLGICPNCGKNLNHGHCDCNEKIETTSTWTALNGLRERLRAEENQEH